jgi:hypothetical protein
VGRGGDQGLIEGVGTGIVADGVGTGNDTIGVGVAAGAADGRTVVRGRVLAATAARGVGVGPTALAGCATGTAEALACGVADGRTLGWVAAEAGWVGMRWNWNISSAKAATIITSATPATLSAEINDDRNESQEAFLSMASALLQAPPKPSRTGLAAPF